MGALINGEYFAFADISLGFEGAQIVAIKAINYSDTLGRVYVRGAARKPIGSTSGRYEPKADFEIYLPTWNILLPILQAQGIPWGGWRRFPFDISVSYASDQAASSLQVTTDVISQCTIKDVEAAQTESDEPLARKIVLFPQEVLWGGVQTSIIEPEKLFSIG
jgi:hypothetical protein